MRSVDKFPDMKLHYLGKKRFFYRRSGMSCIPKNPTAPDFLTQFQAVEDPCQDAGIIYPMDEIPLLVLCAVLSGADGWTSIALYGQMK